MVATLRVGEGVWQIQGRLSVPLPGLLPYPDKRQSPPTVQNRRGDLVPRYSDADNCAELRWDTHGIVCAAFLPVIGAQLLPQAAQGAGVPSSSSTATEHVVL